MKIAGLQKLTLLDFPGKTAATVFTIGCNFRCPFCHNAELVIPIDARFTTKSSTEVKTPVLAQSSISKSEFFSFLDKRHGLLDGICITGGEPTLQHDLAEFCAQIKEKGFLVKLDTNGYKPDTLKQLLDGGLVDYVAMDIKNSPALYAKTIGFDTVHPIQESSFNLDVIERSLKLLLHSKVSFEFRTTVLAELHTEQSLQDTATWIAKLAQEENYSLNEISWYLQQFVDSKNVMAGEGFFSPWEEESLRGIFPVLKAILPQTELRGI